MKCLKSELKFWFLDTQGCLKSELPKVWISDIYCNQVTSYLNRYYVNRQVFFSFFFLPSVFGISPCYWIVHHHSLFAQCHFKAYGLLRISNVCTVCTTLKNKKFTYVLFILGLPKPTEQLYGFLENIALKLQTFRYLIHKKECRI